MKFLRVKYLHDILYTAKHALPFLVATDFSNNNNNNEICAMWKQKAAQVIPTVISSTGAIPKSLSQSLTRLKLAPQYIYTTAKICNSRHMFNCKKLFKLQIRPLSLILSITTSQNR